MKDLMYRLGVRSRRNLKYGKISKVCSRCGPDNQARDIADCKNFSHQAPIAEQAVPVSDPSACGLTKWEQDTFRDILGNVNNTLRFQIQLAVPLLAGCVTALNIIPPQAHQELLNLLDRWVFIPVLFSMAVSYYGLELHWVVQDGKPSDSAAMLSRLLKKKYQMMHLAVLLQGLGLVLLMVFVLLEYK